MAIETLSPEERQISESIQDLKVLVADPSSSRKSIRKLLSHFKVKAKDIQVVESFEDARSMMEDQQPNIVFADYELNGLEILELHRSTQPARKAKAFFMLTGQDSNIMASSAAEQDADAVLIKPLTFLTLHETFAEVIARKLSPTPYHRLVDEARNLMSQGEEDKALKILGAAVTQNTRPALALNYMGQIHLKRGDATKAQHLFEAGLDFDPTHYRCLAGAIESLMAQGKYSDAYPLAERLSTNHTVPMRLIPELVKLSVLNHKFQDVLSFAQIVDDAAKLDDRVTLHLAAGMAVCGLYFLQNKDNKNAVNAFTKAEVFAKGSPKILVRIMSAYAAGGMSAEFKAMSLRAPKEVKDHPDVMLGELRFMQKQGDQSATLRCATQLLQQNIKDISIYEIAIQAAKDLHRSRAVIEDFVWKAAQDFPDKKAYFEGLLPSE